MLTRDQYILPKTAQFGEIFNTRIVSKSSTLASLVRKFMVIIHALITLGLTAKKKMREGAHLMTKEFLQREAWRAILVSSQRYHPFKILAKYNTLIYKMYSASLPQTTPLPSVSWEQTSPQ